jgi:hypothetical protein
MKEDIQSGVKTIDYVVHNVQNAINDMGTTNYRRLLQFAIDGYHELNLYILPQIKSTFITPDDTGTAAFPNDYIFYTAIGVCVGDSIVNLTMKNNMCPPGAEQTPLADILQSGTAFGFGPYSYYYGTTYRNGQYVGELYGVGGGWNKHGYYKEDRGLRQFNFSNILAGRQLILEYKASGIDCDGSVVIPLEAVPALRAYVLWQIEEHNSQIAPSIKERKYRMYIKEYDRLRFFVNRKTVSEFLDQKYKYGAQTAKR